MKKEYIIFNVGCDDDNVFTLEMTEKELEFVIKLAEKNNIRASVPCKPEIFIAEFKNTYYLDDYSQDEMLSKSYCELI